jgi:hypothetical protein
VQNLKILCMTALLTQVLACAQVPSATAQVSQTTQAATTPSVTATTAITKATPPVVVVPEPFDNEKMVSDMLGKIRKFLVERPLRVEDVLQIFELKEAERRIDRLGYGFVFTQAKFPLSTASTSDSSIGVAANQNIYSLGLGFYKPSHSRPAGSPWCFPLNPVLKSLVALNFESKAWDNGKTTHVVYIRQLPTGKYDGVTPVYDGSCLVKFLYSPEESFIHIKKQLRMN